MNRKLPNLVNRFVVRLDAWDANYTPSLALQVLDFLVSERGGWHSNQSRIRLASIFWCTHVSTVDSHGPFLTRDLFVPIHLVRYLSTFPALPSSLPDPCSFAQAVDRTSPVPTFTLSEFLHSLPLFNLQRSWSGLDSCLFVCSIASSRFDLIWPDLSWFTHWHDSIVHSFH